MQPVVGETAAWRLRESAIDASSSDVRVGSAAGMADRPLAEVMWVKELLSEL
jgi:hypothetical protein